MLSRRTIYAVTSDGKLARGLESTYRRNGTVNPCAALEVAMGRVRAKTTGQDQKTKKGFLAFTDDLLRKLPRAEEYHAVVDNHSIHKRHDAWLARHPNVFFHYTPTSTSWMNMVGIWPGTLARKTLRGASFEDTKALCQQIEMFTEVYNEAQMPFA